MRVLALLLPLALATAALADTRRISFWPDAVPAAIQKHVDGGYALDAVRALGKFHRVQGSPGFKAAADWVAGELCAAGVEVRIEHMEADGKTSYAHFKSYLGWNATEGRLDEVAPTRRVIGDFARERVALADYSQDADVTAEL